MLAQIAPGCPGDGFFFIPLECGFEVPAQIVNGLLGHPVGEAEGPGGMSLADGFAQIG